MDESQSGKKASLIIIAWPETLVAMIPRWYARPLSMIGVVRNGRIRAGHAAAAQIDHATGEVHYSDFGRYITPEGTGRTRTKLTDPEVEMPLRAEFGPGGDITNLEAILQMLASRPAITHGDGPMYASLATGIDADAATAFTTRMNLAGSMAYDPFSPTASNCARYVYDLVCAAFGPGKRRDRLKRNSHLTPSPLGTVMFGADGPVWRVADGRMDIFEKPSKRSVIGNFFQRPELSPVAEHDRTPVGFTPHRNDQLLTGTGSSSYFRILDRHSDGRNLLIRRTEADGEIRFEKRFEVDGLLPGETDKMVFVHDTNAHWASIEVSGQRLRYLAV